MPKAAVAVLLNVKRIVSLVSSKETFNSFLFIRIASILLIFALIAPMLFIGEFGRAKAQTNLPFQQPAPVTAPPEPYIFSSGSNSLNAEPVFNAIGNTLSNGYSKAAAFVSGPTTPEGLGAATPPPTASERFLDFIDSLITTKTEAKESAPTKSNPALLPTTCSPRRLFDFDNDCKADIGRWQSNSYQYKVYNSSNSTFTELNLGSSSSKIAPEDFDGDGKFDMTVFSAGAWTIRKSATNSNWTPTWGTTGDLPVPADYDGDGIGDLAIYRPSTNTFWVLTSLSGFNSYTSTTIGTSGDITVPGDYDGDGKADCAVFRPSTGYWYYQPSMGGSIVSYAWGVPTDIPAPGDFTGDGKTDITVFRPSTGTWYILKSEGGTPNYIQTTWGNLGDQPVPADYDGDGKADMSVYRPTTGSWWIKKSMVSSPDYMVLSLGTSSDKAVPSAYLKQSGAELYPDQLAPARLAPINVTGGTNYYSRNSGWSTGLVSLPGRAGMNLNIGMSYNSLVWTKVGSTMAFDMDKSNLAPGFNFGFPRIEPAYINSQTSILSYLMVSPSGSRTEFRQTAASDTYETADSSYAQVKVNNPVTSINSITYPTPIEDITLTVTGTGGTQMLYSWIGNAYRCTKITDSNGNYITISNNTDGQLTSVTDSLGRVVTVNYDTSGRPSSITQNWQMTNGSGSNTTHTWASFTYTTKTINTGFDSTLSVYGPANSSSISVLDKVIFADTSYTKFEYNGYGQVFKISNYADNDGLLNYVWRDIETPPSSPAPQDCPRFTQTKTYAANFNGGNDVTVNNSFTTGASFTPPGSSSVTGTKIEIKTPDSAGAADALVTQIYSASTGWAEGLPVLVKDYATESSTLTEKRWSWTNWTQENNSLSYIKNPRVTETKVGDGTNTKRTTIDYLMQPNSSSVTQYGLVSAVKVYDTNQSTVLKTQTTTYSDSSNYISRRIIGLPLETKLYEGTDSGTLMSRVAYAYDEYGYSGTGQSVMATQHDNENYGTSFYYRGNLTSTTRHETPSSNSSVSSSIKYNITGSPISQTDPRGRVTTISYTDSWNDTVSRSATYAYPTTLTDSGNNSSEIKYRYDIGANVWARSPTPYNSTPNSYGKTTSRKYDDPLGRITEQKIENIGGAYTRYDYQPDGTSVDSYTTVIDANNDDAGTGDEVRTETLLDGVGRVRRTRTENPDAANTYIGKLVEYDILGQVKRETVPTRIDSSWNPTGDDVRYDNQSQITFLWMQKEYDWKGRVTKEINTDGSDKLYSYEGCGCAGGEVVTIKGEVTTAADVSGTQQTTKRRTQKIYADILGRTKKTEIWDLDGGGTVPYSTTVNTYNARDQITNVREYSGSDSSSTYQDTTMSYDGHGRLSQAHRPENFDAGNNNALTYTSYTYNADDSVATVTDPRGAITTYTYGTPSTTEKRAVLTNIEFTPPSNSTIPDTPDVIFTYDAAGNRKTMSDGTGTLSYEYDELSRLKIETKDFTDTLADEPTGGYKLKYNYHLTGGLKSIEDPFGAVVTYAADKLGRTTAVGGSGFTDTVADPDQEITSYVTNINYRAFGSVKSMSYATTAANQVTLDYNNRLQPLTYEVSSSANTGDTQNVSYSYFNDGSVKEAVNSVDSRFSQYYDYDFAGRLKRNEFGGGSGGLSKPYKQTLGYDAFNNITSRSTWTWGTERSFTSTYTNNRRSSGGYGYSANTLDIEGNIIQNFINGRDKRTWKYDAAGRTVDWEETLPYVPYYFSTQSQGAELTYDGDGRSVKRLKRHRQRIQGTEPWNYEAEYQIYSSVTGQKITTLDNTGKKSVTLVYMGSSVIAEQKVLMDGSVNLIAFKHTAPVTGNIEETELSGEISTYAHGKSNFGALGAVIPPEDEEEVEMPNYQSGGHTKNPEHGCTIDGMPISCNRAKDLLRAWGYPGIGDGFAIFSTIERTKSYKLVIRHGSDNQHEGTHNNEGTDDNIVINTAETHMPFSFTTYQTQINFVSLPGGGSEQINYTHTPTVPPVSPPPPPGETCGVNPVTREPGIKRKPYNGFGTIRDDSKGNGEYNASRGGKGYGHKGIDISGLLGQMIFAFLGGKITRSEYVKDYGNTIEITHPNGLVSKYHHLEKLMGDVDDDVEMGDVIGLLGQTGNAGGTNPHVDFEIFLNGVKQNPVTILNSSCPK
jgi:YD repeat-containing protein